jgi:hypothetical protein
VGARSDRGKRMLATGVGGTTYGSDPRRAARRRATDTLATFRADDAEWTTRVVDISICGARIAAAPAAPVRGAATLFLRGHGALACRIAWQRDGFMGLEFSRRLREEDVARL